jgi:hypothetical protein
MYGRSGDLNHLTLGEREPASTTDLALCEVCLKRVARLCQRCDQVGQGSIVWKRSPER